MKQSFSLAKGAVNHVMKHYHHLLKIYLTYDDIKSIAFYIEIKRFDNILYLYGHEILLGLLEYFVEIEEYEICAHITRAIKQHNKESKDTIPLKLEKTNDRKKIAR